MKSVFLLVLLLWFLRLDCLTGFLIPVLPSSTTCSLSPTRSCSASFFLSTRPCRRLASASEPRLFSDPLSSKSSLDVVAIFKSTNEANGDDGGGDVSDDIDLTPLAFGSSPEQEQLLTNNGGHLPLWLLALAGCLTTLVADMTMHPVDCIKTLQQSGIGYGLDFVQAVQYLYDTDGLAGFYHGFLTYALSDALGGMLKFSTWELWKQRQPISIINNNNNEDNDQKSLLVLQLLQWGYLWLGAAVAFVVSSVVIVPGEFLKNQLQMDKFHGVLEAVTAISSQHGLLGFFVGYEGVLYRDIPYTMLELGLYEIFKSILDKSLRRDDSIHSRGAWWEDVAAAAVTGGITAFLTTPLDVIKTKLMVDDDYAGYSFVDCWIASVDAHGWESVFAGVVARIAWIMPFTTIYLPTYDLLKRIFLKRYLEYLASASSQKVLEE